MISGHLMSSKFRSASFGDMTREGIPSTELMGKHNIQAFSSLHITISARTRSATGCIKVIKQGQR